MKNVKRIVILFLIVAIGLTVIISNVTYAYNMMATINNQVNANADINVVNKARKISGSVITITRVICSAVAVTMLIAVAMKYMVAAPGEKADIKKHAVIYVVGAVIMFACTGILGIIQKFAGSI